MIPTESNLTKASQQRIEAFVEWFIRSEYVERTHSENCSDYLHNPERAERCDRAAAHAADGSTHQEIIDDWRTAFASYMQDRNRRRWQAPERFIAAVNSHFDATEEWHVKHGSIDEALG